MTSGCAKGFIELTDGNVIDYDVIHARILEDAAATPFRELAFDPWNATQLSTQLMGDGLTMVEVRQGYISLSGPMKEIEKLLLEGKIRHGGNPVLRWMCSNVAVVMDPAGNKKPAKNKSSGPHRRDRGADHGIRPRDRRPTGAGPSLCLDNGLMEAGRELDCAGRGERHGLDHHGTELGQSDRLRTVQGL
jgi:hypothetical protein